MKKKCPCCGFYTIDSDDEVITDICEVCFWQYDITAHEQHERSIGPNGISLDEAKANYKKYGACKREFADKKFVRKPLNEELSSKREKAGVKYMQRWEELAYAREDGIAEGEIKGDYMRLVSQICKKMKMNQSLEKIAEDLVEEVSVIEPIYNMAKNYAPDYDPKEVFKQMSFEFTGG